MPKIKALYVYPVKGLKPISLTSADVSETGLPWDRHWLITRPDGRFLTQRQIPKYVVNYSTSHSCYTSKAEAIKMN
jgi:uncharacterized protein YcbX